jgi:hypothetical protein
MSKVQKAISRALSLVLGLSMVLLLVNCSGEAVTPVVDTPDAGIDRSVKYEGEEATGDGDGQSLDQRLDLKWGITEFVTSTSGLFGNQGGNLRVDYDHYHYQLSIGTSVFTRQQGIGMHVTKGRNLFNENLAYITFSPQSVTLNHAVTFEVVNIYNNSVRWGLYYWSDTNGWLPSAFLVTETIDADVSFTLDHFGTYALLASPIPYVENTVN